MEIRRATAADALAMAQVIVSSWRWAYRGLLPDDYLDSLDASARAERIRGSLEDDSSGVEAWVAVDGGRVVGAASAGPPLTGEDHAPEEPPPDSGELYLIYLEPDAVGTGAGRALLHEAVEGLRARGFSSAFLWVLDGNALARRFYEKAGWGWDGTTSSHLIECRNMPVVRYVTAI